MSENTPEPAVDEPGDPAATDTGDVAAVPDEQRADVDTVEPNDDAGDPLDDVDDGEVVDPNTEG